MSESEPQVPTRDQLMREAAAWFARMRGPDAEASRAEFEAWLRRGALHRGAYNRAAEIFAMGKVLSEEEPAQGSAPRPRKLAPMLAGLVALAAVGGLAIHLTPSQAPSDGGGTIQADSQADVRMRLASGAGTRTVRLPDGSRILLAPDTMVEARLDGTERRFDLAHGRARFEVFRETRPFRVHAGGGSVTARGTIFDVALSPEREVTVRLIEGEVDVRLPAEEGTVDPSPVTRRLRPGEELSFRSRPVAVAPAPARPAERPAARQVTVASERSADTVRDYDRASVAELVAAANEASSRPIFLADPAIAERRVSGRFRVDDTGLLAERLAHLFELRAEQDDPARIVLRPR